ncbi:MAG: hypothetical protein A2W35_14570 [Chloroflexi bacterium RBG_16_57_11]|nr:MAG: hypothetical protein A2W35_14570 [Chloroflexi bacterium RBG_16_57_11]
MAIFKVSYVIVGNANPGMILNQDHMPQKGDRVQLGTEYFEIIEVMELVPPRGEFHYIHVTCRPSGKKRKIR